MVELKRDLTPDDIMVMDLHNPTRMVAFAEVNSTFLLPIAPSFSNKEDALATRAKIEAEHPELLHALGPTPEDYRPSSGNRRLVIKTFAKGRVSIWLGLNSNDLLRFNLERNARI